MTDENAKRFTMAQIRRMTEAGQFVPTATDAPEQDFDNSFWRSAQRANAPGTSKTQVQLELDRETVDQFRRQGADYLDRMAEVLNQHARKAS
jgi:uncharacterized protein (DUF4415 family)